MSLYKYLKDLWKAPKKNLGDSWKEHLIEWRREPVTTRIAKPTRLDRARSIGYKAKQGIVVVRQRVMRGGHMRPDEMGGRRPKHSRQKMVLDKNYQQVAEERASKAFPNCEALGSYYLAKDGKHAWYEVILVDRAHPAIKKDKNLSWITQDKHKGRAFRGKTTAGRKSRGLMNKGKGAEKVRPSKKASMLRRQY
ncbi:50S ribosomal protein L15e [Candidatus Woesearchaeota archaeon]|nr:50S ribosomal protein L15e [Candidatus Woesearchaeota archaeon]